MSQAGLEKTITNAFAARDKIGASSKGEVREAVEAALELLDRGEARVAERQPDGKWRVTVHSFEPDASMIGTRSFDVVANGRTRVSMVVPRRERDAAPTVVARRFIADAIEGRLTLEFIGRQGAAIVSDIEIVRPSSQARTTNMK